MSTKPANVVAATAQGSSAAGAEYRALDNIVGRWLTLGHTFGPDGQPDLPIATTDVYEWAPGGFFIVHTAYGLIGGHSAGGIEIIGYSSETGQFHTTFFDSEGSVSPEELTIDGSNWRWVGATVRCTGTLDPGGQRLVCHHERLDGDNWAPSMEVTLTKIL